MTPAQRLIIDNQHAQKFADSCPASLCEMLLKLAGAVPVDFFDFQNGDPRGSDGVSKFVDQALPQNHTIKRMNAGSWEFPIGEMKTKLAAGVPVGIYLNPVTAKAHGWLVDEIRTNVTGEEEIVLVSKYSEEGRGEGQRTAIKIIKVADAAAMRWSDPIYPEKLTVASAPAKTGNGSAPAPAE